MIKVWCSFDCLDGNRRKVLSRLWIQIEMPVLMPIGSNISLPASIGETEISGAFYGKVTGYELSGSLIECQLEMSTVFDDDYKFSDMLAIGYLDNEPSEILAAVIALERAVASQSGVA